MQLLEITEDVKEKLGLISCHITKNAIDIMTSLKKISPTMGVFTCTDNGIVFSYGESFYIHINTKAGCCDVEVIVETKQAINGLIICEVTFKSPLLDDVVANIEEINKILHPLVKRKEKRILCTKDRLEKLNLNPRIPLLFRKKDYPGYIKDLSYSAIQIITDKHLLSEAGELFHVRLNFSNPIERIVFESYVIRKELFIIDGKELALIVLRINANVRYNERLTKYFLKYDLELSIAI